MPNDASDAPSETSLNSVNPSAASLEEAQAAAAGLTQEIARVVVGQEEVIEQVLMALFSRSHAVLVGVPGLAKTLLVSTIARALNLSFARIQFTPDLMPSDITGTEIIQEDATTGRRELTFVRGPVFANLLLADEINRTPPKTQAALLEAMQEGQVTAAGRRHELPAPFFVLATQNPIEQEGTYPLPEAQLDRFLFQIHVDYPTEEDELEIVRRTTTGTPATIQPVLDVAKVTAIQQLVRDVPVADHVIRYALRVVRATRPSEQGPVNLSDTGTRLNGGSGAGNGVDNLSNYLSWGAGPRASQGLVLAAKARAVLQGRTSVSVADVKAVALPVLRHRILTNFAAEADGIRTDELIRRLLDGTPEQEPASAEAQAVLR